jgi:spore coat-associated protein N
MSIKKKLGMGALSGALALALIGGGTLAAFNDVEAFDNHFATGTLDLEVELGDEAEGQTVHGNFDLTNLKPGDSMTRTFKLKNAGTLGIQHVLLHFDEEAIANSFQGQEGVTWEDFLDQFQVEVFRVDQGTGEDDVTEHPPFYIIEKEHNMTLLNLVKADYTQAFLADMEDYLVESDFYSDGRKLINLAPIKGERGDPHWQYNGLPVEPSDTELVTITITMIDDPTRMADVGGGDVAAAFWPGFPDWPPNWGGDDDKDHDDDNDNGGDREYSGSLDDALKYVQNRYQNTSVAIPFVLEATQWDGIHGTENGYHDEENERSHPESQPNPYAE